MKTKNEIPKINRCRQHKNRSQSLALLILFAVILSSCGGGGGSGGSFPTTAIGINDSINGALTASSITAPDGTYVNLYTIELSSPTELTVRVESIEFDTILGLFSGTALSESNLNNWDTYSLAENDDESSESTNSALTIQLTAGKYVIVVNSFDPATGTYTLATAEGGSGLTDSGQSLGKWDTVSVALGDLDSDGDLDMVEGNYFQANIVWLNNGSGTFNNSGQSLGAAETDSVALGDLDGDGDLDLVEGVYGQGNTIWFNDGSANFTDSGQSLGNAATMSVALGDLDGDGDLDLVSGNLYQGNSVWLNNGSGIFTDSGQTLGNWNTVSVALGDLDGDGDLDLAAGNFFDHANTIWLNDGNGTFSDTGQALGSLKTRSVALGDLDADGDLDLVTGEGGQGNTVWRNNGSAIFSDTGQSLDNLETWSVALGDLNGDGHLDLVAGNIAPPPPPEPEPGEANTVWLNEGGGTFINSGQLLGHSDTRSVALGDLDDDGDIDLVTGNNYGQANRVYINSTK